jgi:mono/diheme cytochrome c family protein
MKTILFAIFALLPITLLCFVVACAPAGVSGDTSGDSAGASLYASDCASCHGADARGGSGPSIAGVSDSQAVIDVILNGSGGMPGFAGSLTDADIADILAYLGSL